MQEWPAKASVSAILIALSLAVAASCGDDSESAGTVDFHPPGGIHEGALMENPTASLNLDHTVIVILEPAGTHHGDSGSEEGVDHLPYHFEFPTDVVLSVDEFEDPPTLTVLDADGSEIHRVEPGSGEQIVTLHGEHTIQLEHPQAGDTEALPMVVFLQPGGGKGAGRSRLAAAVTSPSGTTDTASEPKQDAAVLDGNTAAITGNGAGTGSGLGAAAVLVPEFAAPVVNPFGLPVNGTDAAPAFQDFVVSPDGDFDIMVGYSSGDVWGYLNVGSVTSPSFADLFGVPVIGLDPDTNAKPTVVDINAAGDLDTFIGTGSGTLSAEVNSPGRIDIGENFFGLTPTASNSAPFFADIDNDGDPDAFVGSGSGDIWYAQNVGSASSPSFAAPLANPFGLTKRNSNSTPTLADLDRDGDLDVFVGGGNGDIWYFANIGSAGNPSFAAHATNPFGLTVTGSNSAPSFVDIDADGDLDAFIGVGTGDIWYFQLIRTFSVTPTATRTPTRTRTRTRTRTPTQTRTPIDTPNPSDVATLMAGKDCIGCDLRGLFWDACDLSFYYWEPGVAVAGLDLNSADFTDATLKCVYFVSDSAGNPTLLTGAVFDDATLVDGGFSGSEHTGGKFRRTKFQGSQFSYLKSVALADFSNATFDNSYLAGSLQRADFSNASFSAGSCLTSNDLRDAVFAGATFDATTSVNGTWFAGSDLSGARFAGTEFLYNQNFCSNCARKWQCGTQSSPTGCWAPPSSSCHADFSCLTPWGGQEVRCANLQGVTFQSVDLRYMDFRGADLTNAAVRGSVLDQTNNFAGANLSGADFSQQNLGPAVDFSKSILSKETNFAGARLSDAPESSNRGVILACDRTAGTGLCDFSGTTQFKNANLQYVNLDNAGLTGADLSGANLGDASLIGANLNLSNLACASMVGTQLGVTPGSGQSAAQLSGAYMIGVDLSSADLSSVNLSGAHLYNSPLCTGKVSFKDATMSSTNLGGAVLAGADFTNANLRNAVFSNTYLVDAIFNGSDLQNASFNSAHLHGVDFATGTISGVSLANAAVSVTAAQATSMLNQCGLPGPGSWTFIEQDGQPITFMFNETALGNLATSTAVTFTCPDSGVGPCTTLSSLCPVAPPFPPLSGGCRLDARACYQNCNAGFNCCTACRNCWSGDCSLCLASCG